MAIVQRGALKVSFTYRDETMSLGKGEAYLPVATTLASAQTLAAALVEDIAAATDCVVLGYSITAGYVENAPAAAAAGSRVENKAVFQFRTAAGKISKFTLPGIKPALVNAAGGIISSATAAAAVIADITTSAWCDSNGSDLTNLYADYQRFSPTSKRQLTTDTSPVDGA